MNQSTASPVIAIVMGIGCGMLLSVIGQKMLNNHYQEHCKYKSNHSLIYVKGFLGDQYYCVPKSWSTFNH